MFPGPASSHLLPLERPAEFNQLVTDFLNVTAETAGNVAVNGFETLRLRGGSGGVDEARRVAATTPVTP